MYIYISYFLFLWWFACCIEEATTPYYQGTLLMFSMVMNLNFSLAAKYCGLSVTAVYNYM